MIKNFFGAAFIFIFIFIFSGLSYSQTLYQPMNSKTGTQNFEIAYLDESGGARNPVNSTTCASAVSVLKDITLTGISIVSNNAINHSYAMPGSLVSVSFKAVGPLTGAPSVTIAGKPSPVSSSGTNAYTASKIMDSTDAEGVIPFSIIYKNSTGQDCTRSDITSGAPVKFDKTPPALTYVSLASSNIDPSAAIAGDVLTLSYVSSEPLRPNHGFALAGNFVIPYTAGSVNYFAECILDFNDIRAGNAGFSIEFYDLAGNRGADVISTTDATAVTFDTSRPAMKYVSVSSSNTASDRAVTGDTVTLKFASTKTLNAMPAVTIAGRSVEPAAAGCNEYRASYVMAPGDARGRVLFTIDYADTAGLAGNRVTASTDLTSVTFDDTPPPANPKIFKVLVINYDPIVESEGGARLHTLCEGRNDPRPMAEQYINDLKNCSNRNAKYRIVEWLDIDEYPVKKDGFRYTDETFMACLRGQAPWHEPSALDYAAVIKDFNIAWRIKSGEIDEVILFGAHWFGAYESQMAGPTAYWCNSPPITIEEPGKNFVIMWFNYGRGIGEMLENYCHRAESIMDRVYGRAQAGPPQPWEKLNNWQKFTNYDRYDPGRASAGSCHWAPNSLRDYDWGNSRPVFSTCDDWFNWPNLTGAGRIVTCDDWGGGDMREHHKWW
nr:hypothetical protein [Candidatus Wallbacteria bacterium]